MRISGFTIARNAVKFYFPLKESILSILPLVDEFIVALGDSEDETEEVVRSLNSPKIRIFRRKWDERLFRGGEILRHETNFALSKCSGDWCFYLQADEVVHEEDLEKIRHYCEKYLEDERVEGFLFNYYHFWGDYNHYLPVHGWYQQEIRIVRNRIGIESYKDAQSFRLKGRKLRVVHIPVYIYHYGWVRPPEILVRKRAEQEEMHVGRGSVNRKELPEFFDYGPLGRIPEFKGTHPKVMEERIKAFNWSDKLNYSKEGKPRRKPFKHERFKYRFIDFLEKRIFRKPLFSYNNWKIIGVER